jgi:hypothetical protein
MTCCCGRTTLSGSGVDAADGFDIPRYRALVRSFQHAKSHSRDLVWKNASLMSDLSHSPPVHVCFVGDRWTRSESGSGRSLGSRHVGVESPCFRCDVCVFA